MTGCREADCARHIEHWREVVRTGRWTRCATSYADAAVTLASALMVCEVFHEQVHAEFSRDVRCYRSMVLRGVRSLAWRLGTNLEYLGIEVNHRCAAV